MAGAGGGAGGVGWARRGRAKHTNSSAQVVGMRCFMGREFAGIRAGLFDGVLSAVIKPPLCKAPMKLRGRIVKPE